MQCNINSTRIFCVCFLLACILLILVLVFFHIAPVELRQGETDSRSREARVWEKDLSGIDIAGLKWLPASSREHEHVYGMESEGFRQIASQASLTLESLLDAMPGWTDDPTLVLKIDCLKEIPDQNLMLLEVSASRFWELDACLDLAGWDNEHSKKELRLNALNITEKGRPKIFQIGFNKAGTRSLWTFFHRTGIASAHWEGGTLAKTMMDNLKRGVRLMNDWEPMDGYTDMYHGIECIPERDRKTRYRQISGYRFFRELDQQYPGSLFILNVRNLKDWINSRALHPGNCFNHWADIWPDVRWMWALEWYIHMAGVLSYFGGLSYVKPQGDLLVFDISHDDVSLLHDFLRTRPDTKEHPRMKLERVTTLTDLCKINSCPSPQERADAYKSIP